MAAPNAFEQSMINLNTGFNPAKGPAPGRFPLSGALDLDKALMSEGMSAAAPNMRTVTSLPGQMGPTARFPTPQMPTAAQPAFKTGFGAAPPPSAPAATPAASVRPIRAAAPGGIPTAAPVAAPGAMGMLGRAASLASKVAVPLQVGYGLYNTYRDVNDDQSALNQNAAARKAAVMKDWNAGNYASAAGDLALGGAATGVDLVKTFLGFGGRPAAPAPAGGVGAPPAAAPAAPALTKAQQWAHDNAGMTQAQALQLLQMAPKPRTSADIIREHLGQTIQGRYDQQLGTVAGQKGAAADKAKGDLTDKYITQLLQLIQGQAVPYAQMQTLGD